MQISQKGLNLIKEFEGLSLVPYKCKVVYGLLDMGIQMVLMKIQMLLVVRLGVLL